MCIDRVIITTFPGYFFTTVLCLRSVIKYFSYLPIDVIVDDFNLNTWPTYVNDCKQYLITEFPHINITFHFFSQLNNIDDAKHGGWFRQQLIKLHLDQLVADNNWLSVDADLIFNEYPNLNIVPVVSRAVGDVISFGNQEYVKYLLDIERPFLGVHNYNLCASGVPFRKLSRELLKGLRQRVEQVHKKNFLQLHIDLMKSGQIVAFDPYMKKMIMSEFQLIEVYRDQFCNEDLYIKIGTSAFEHDSIKDWNRKRAWFESQGVQVTDQLWHNSQRFGQAYV